MTDLIKLTCHVTDLVSHRVGVDLAHVGATVGLSHVPQGQRPRVVVAVCHRQTVEVGDDRVVDRQDRLTVGFNPGHLAEKGAHLSQ